MIYIFRNAILGKKLKTDTFKIGVLTGTHQYNPKFTLISNYAFFSPLSLVHRGLKWTTLIKAVKYLDITRKTI